MKCKTTGAFTLLELLVVIAIVSILAGLLLTTVARARRTAHTVACKSQLKQWGIAAEAYADDNENRLPREAGVDGINSWDIVGASTNANVWYNALPQSMRLRTGADFSANPSSQSEFYERAGHIFHCPAARFSASALTYPHFSLAFNSKLMLDTEPVIKMNAIVLPHATALFLDCGVPGEPKLHEFQANYNGQPKAYANRFSGRHGNAGNILFFDQHVDRMPAHKVVEMDNNSPNRGRAIYPSVELIWRHDPELVP